MSQQEKSAYYAALKAAGVEFTKHYREYSTEELKAAYDKLVPSEQPVDSPDLGPLGPLTAGEPQQPVISQDYGDPVDEEAAAFFGLGVQAQAAAPPVAAKDPNEIAGQRRNVKDDLEPIRTDPETGFTWFQEEVRKPAYPKPRARRVLRYQDAGVETRTVKSGDYTESFEVSGDPANAREAEVKITMPSYQVGIYSSPSFPFKVICYNGNEGFDLFDVQKFYGGAELVPQWVKRKYVENVLCYDMRSVIQEIESEFRRMQLQAQRG